MFLHHVPVSRSLWTIDQRRRRWLRPRLAADCGLLTKGFRPPVTGSHKNVWDLKGSWFTRTQCTRPQVASTGPPGHPKAHPGPYGPLRFVRPPRPVRVLRSIRAQDDCPAPYSPNFVAPFIDPSSGKTKPEPDRKLAHFKSGNSSLCIS
jgi:hypothetical protein